MGSKAYLGRYNESCEKESNVFCFLYEYFGAHKVSGTECKEDKEDKEEYIFRVYAPDSKKAFLVSDFTDWEIGKEMTELENGVYECSVDTGYSLEGCFYKFRLIGENDVGCKADPFARRNENEYPFASVVSTEKKVNFKDAAWVSKKKKLSRDDFKSAPVNIYTIHPASWQTRESRTNIYKDSYLNYREIADRAVPYLKKMGYTHADLMPIAEYSEDLSLGYKTCGFFAPSSRFGTADDFAYLVNKLHANGLGVIVQFSDLAATEEEFSLLQPIFENNGDGCGEALEKYSKSFFASALSFWISEFHIDGIRLSLGDGRIGSAACEIFSALKEIYPELLIIEEGGVHDTGFSRSLKIDRAYTERALEISRYDPFFRKHLQGAELPFTEPQKNALLAVTHHDVTGENGSLLERMFGNYRQKFAGMKLFFSYQMISPGKKLLFMGCEFGQFKKWDPENSLEWFMYNFEMHYKLSEYVRRLNNLYLSRKALHTAQGVTLNGYNKEDGVLVVTRQIKDKESLTAVLNFSGRPLYSYRINVRDGEYKELLSSDKEQFGGDGLSNKGIIKSKNGTAYIDVAPLSAVILERIN